MVLKIPRGDSDRTYSCSRLRPITTFSVTRDITRRPIRDEKTHLTEPPVYTKTTRSYSVFLLPITNTITNSNVVSTLRQLLFSVTVTHKEQPENKQSHVRTHTYKHFFIICPSQGRQVIKRQLYLSAVYTYVQMIQTMLRNCLPKTKVLVNKLQGIDRNYPRRQTIPYAKRSEISSSTSLGRQETIQRKKIKNDVKWQAHFNVLFHFSARMMAVTSFYCMDLLEKHVM